MGGPVTITVSVAWLEVPPFSSLTVYLIVTVPEVEVVGTYLMVPSAFFVNVPVPACEPTNNATVVATMVPLPSASVSLPATLMLLRVPVLATVPPLSGLATGAVLIIVIV